jgi:YHS domain-containing protein
MPRERSWILARALLAALALVACARASAGDFFEKDGLALRGYDAVAYFREAKPVKGSAEHRAEYRGSTFLFASRENRDAFAAEPAKYAPQYGGFCAYGVASGYKAATDPAAFTVVDGKLYLNYNRDVQQRWSRDISGHVAKADRNWPAAAKQTRVVD